MAQRPLVALLELLGRRWQLRVIWELRDDAATFRELQDRCDGMSPSVLATRLDELRAAGIVEHDDGYRLTPIGRELLELYPPIRRWAERWQDRLDPRR